MYRRSLLNIVAIATVIVGVGQSEARTASGRVVTCPGGDPIADYPVYVCYEDGSLIGVVNTDHLGKWVIDISFIYPCGQLFKAYIVTNRPPGKICPGGCCSERITAENSCYNDVHFDDLQFKCGVKIQCPQSQ